MSKKYEGAAVDILAGVGGAENVNTLRHCQTRLRFALKDQAKANRKVLEALPSVLKIIPTEGMYQIVIGTDVADCYEEIVKLLPQSSSSAGEVEEKPNVSPVTAVIDFISGTFQPIIPALSGAGMLKALMALLVVFHIIDNNAQTYYIINSNFAVLNLQLFNCTFSAFTLLKSIDCNFFVKTVLRINSTLSDIPGFFARLLAELPPVVPNFLDISNFRFPAPDASL